MKTKKTNTFLRVLSLTFALSFIVSAFVGCKKDETEDAPLPEGVIDISEYAIVREEAADDLVISQTVSLKNAIKNLIGNDLSVTTDATAAVEKEILIGKTNRPESQAALDKLAKATKDEAYIIDITDNKIVIVGTTDQATFHATKIFIEDYVKMSTKNVGLSIAAGKTSAKNYNSENIEILDNGVEIEVTDKPLTLLSLTGINKIGETMIDTGNAGYPKAIQLQHQPNEEDNGKLIAHFRLSDSRFSSTNAFFIESNDDGKTWSVLSRPTEQNKENMMFGLKPGQMCHIYELPEKLGKYPAGTLVYSCGSINYDIRSEIWIWYSTDCGKTWRQTTEIAEGVHSGKQSWGYTGVWEPYSIYEDGYLYCFYSDDRDVDEPGKHDQKLVYRRTKDGVNWEDPVDVCCFNDHRDRPGMAIITKMGNGEFIMVYEYYGKNFKSPTAGEIYYKKTKDISDWGDPSDEGTLIKAGNYSIEGAPAMVWVPAGGECGTLIVSARLEKNGDETYRLMVSNDYGETWVTMTNPLPYKQNKDGKMGRSAAFVAGADGHTVYYINMTNIPGTETGRLQFIKFKVY